MLVNIPAGKLEMEECAAVNLLQRLLLTAGIITYILDTPGEFAQVSMLNT